MAGFTSEYLAGFNRNPQVGTLLPCNVIVQQHDDGSVEVSAIDPVTSMQGIGNPDLGRLAGAVREMLRNAVNRIA